ncbi:MAG: FG-GAP-like repeat-containing protein, partial [Myxococcales bacterium]|nr:FG-GAP-like repeat-containing protein [Myxococcales bacterium]
MPPSPPPPGVGRDLRPRVLGGLLIALAALFWGLSRGPALSEKATMGAEVGLDALGFDVWMLAHPEDPIWLRVLATALNWLATNRIGMSFGIAFASVLMALLPLLAKPSPGGSGWGASLRSSSLGLAIGAPLGVCVNCAAPIALGLSRGGARLEVALAAMIGSPTLNVVALSLAITLLPVHLWAIKLGFTLLLLLAVLPALAQSALRAELRRDLGRLEAAALRIEAQSEPPRGAALLRSCALALARSFAQVVRITVPAMIAAALLGSLVATLLPWDTLVEILPSATLGGALASTLLLALIGTALPVPITFDVLVCAVLHAAGMPPRYVAVLLFTLGATSVYSSWIVARAISTRAALLVFISVALLGFLAGDLSQAWANADARASVALLDTALDRGETAEPRIRRSAGAALPARTRPPLPRQPETSILLSPRGTRLSARRLAHAGPGGGRFERLDPQILGMILPARLALHRLEFPFVQGRGRSLAVGDVDEDGRDDLLVVSELGLSIHLQRRGGFDAHLLPLPGIWIPLQAALADLDGDGHLDVYLSTLAHGDSLLLGRGQGEFAAPEALPSGSILTGALGLADVDEDGDLDVLLGRWAMAWTGPWKVGEGSTPVLLRNGGGDPLRFLRDEIEAPVGAITSVLFVDLDADGFDDALLGSDFEPPDQPLRRGARGSFTHAPALLPIVTRDTMGLVAADFDGDLREEIFFSDIARPRGDDGPAGELSIEEACALEEASARCLQDAADYRRYLAARRRRQPEGCSELSSPGHRQACVALLFARRPREWGEAEVCGRLPQDWSWLPTLCRESARPGAGLDEATRRLGPRQAQHSNVLLRPLAAGGWIDEAELRGVARGGWGWNPIAFDLEDDGDLDLLLLTGTWHSAQRRESNLLWRNDGRGRFEEATLGLGL